MKTWLAVLLSACWAAAAQQEPRASEPRAGIFGRVLDADRHQAVRRAAVKIYTSKHQWDEFTDGEGRFRFSELTPGDYELISHRDGYTDRSYKVERSDFQSQKELLIEVHQQGVIAGRVISGLGQALQGAQIQALSSRAAGGRLNAAGTAETNDLGEYRLFGLDPGTYQIRATYREGRSNEFDPMVIAISDYGGSERSPGVAVKGGSVLAGIDFVLDPVRAATVRGTLRSETGPFPDPATLWIMGQAGEGGHNAFANNGKFEITDVAPGSYTISAQGRNKIAPRFGLVTVKVGGADVDNVDLVLRPIPRIEAEIRAEGEHSGDVKFGPVFFMPSSPLTAINMAIGQPDKDGKFSVALVPGEYRLSFEATISKIGIRSVNLGDELITDWKIRVSESSGTNKLVIVVGSKP